MDEALRQYELLCDHAPAADELAAMERTRGVWYRTRSIRSGSLLEIQSYPMTGARAARSARRLQPSTEAMKRLNARNAERKLMRLAETNFGKRDYYFTGTIEGPDLPDVDAMQELVVNFIRRLNYLRRKLGLKNSKYIYVLEGHDDGDRKKRLHWHALIEGGVSREQIKALWTHGRARVDELDARGAQGLIPLARYLSKAPQGKKRWARSRNLKEPVESVAERKISSRTAYRIAEGAAERTRALEKLYPGYEVIESEARTNPFLPGCYIYAMMRRKT